MSARDYDAIIIGGGHNGLICAGYLAKAGLEVVLLERRSFVGGAVVTEELFPGYRLSSCSYICHLLQPKVIDDFELRRHGFDVYHLEPSRFHHLHRPPNSLQRRHADQQYARLLSRPENTILHAMDLPTSVGLFDSCKHSTIV